MNDDQVLVLQSDRLRVEMALPGALYRGSRWSWSGFITAVTLDGRHTFCTSEGEDEGSSRGVGLCNEWGIFAPIGYGSAQAGEKFPKLGVGLLTRPDDEPYSFTRPYEIEPFERRIERGAEASGVEIVTQPRECRGYAARLSESFRVTENRLLVATEIENVGSRAIETHEYRHNFLALDGAPIGPDYTLSTRFEIQTSGDIAPDLRIEGRQVRFERTPQKAFLQVLGGASGAGAGAWWELRHASGAHVRETISVPLEELKLWGAAHVLSPEAFVPVRVEPGQSQSWQREYVFCGPRD